ncbi:hypothetical protein AMTR_s00009p00235050 [Amborella trichopoda]|uniref:Glycosyltransferase n=2 Tax=Amborella trichopoda TaxID=13333 RepID=W1NIK4_AMBTC|nr:hypothetical protein AMTR_s00009p00235050 [Amborella trichopoda]
MFGVGDSDQRHHVVVFPLMAQGHMLPMIDLARMLAKRGLAVSIVTTPLNASRIRSILDRAAASGHRMQILEIEFPCMEAGLPEGCENLDSLPSTHLLMNFFEATKMLRDPFEKLIRQTKNPLCIISDTFLPWTAEAAQALGIPRLAFHTSNCFSQCCWHSLYVHQPQKRVGSDTEPFVLPGLSDEITVTKAQLPEHSKENIAWIVSGLGKVLEEMQKADAQSYGTVVNSFHELEPRYVDYYINVMGRKAWPIGPVSLYNRDQADKAERGMKASIDERVCLSWLDSQKQGSVLYVCFGSISHFNPAQLVEIALGLEASRRPFIWVVKGDAQQVDQWLPEGFEERVQGRGMIIRGWAPQLLILSHAATGGFLTHCGWNSVLEGLSVGLPLAAWPMFAEQPLNARLVVDVLKTGVEISKDDPNGLVRKEEIHRALCEVMSNSEMRDRAMKVGEMAGKAVEEGGSSHLSLSLLIEELVSYNNRKQ